jgi:hypothetical protein
MRFHRFFVYRHLPFPELGLIRFAFGKRRDLLERGLGGGGGGLKNKVKKNGF